MHPSAIIHITYLAILPLKKERQTTIQQKQPKAQLGLGLRHRSLPQGAWEGLAPSPAGCCLTIKSRLPFHLPLEVIMPIMPLMRILRHTGVPQLISVVNGYNLIWA